MTRFEKWSVLSTSVATGVTGVGYFGIKYLMEPAEPWAVINHPLQPWLLKAHILVAPALVFAVGAIFARHVWRHFRGGIRWARRSGITAGASVLPMVATGYLIQTLVHEGWVEGMAIAHIALSALYLIGIGAHWWASRGRRRVEVPPAPHRIRIPAGRTHRHGG